MFNILQIVIIMKALKIVIVMFVLIISLGAVCAANTTSDDIMGNDNQNILETTQDDISAVVEPKTFTDLKNDISNSTDVFEVKDDYRFNNASDNASFIPITKNNLIVNGNGHTIDANNQSSIFMIFAKNVTINNLTFINANSTQGSVFYIRSNCSLTTNNVDFIDNAAVRNGIIDVMGKYNSNNDRFIDCTSSMGIIRLFGDELNFNNVFMTSSKLLNWGFIYTEYENANITILNSVFANTTSNFTTAVRGTSKTVIRNSKFINLCSKISVGAVGLKNVNEAEIDNCTFVNVTSQKNGGAILMDVFGDSMVYGSTLVSNSNFVDCYSRFGGALMQLGGALAITNCTFTNNSAEIGGGAIYVSYVVADILNSKFNGNHILVSDSYDTSGGAIYCDFSELSLMGNELTCNSAQYGAALFTYDSKCDVIKNNFTDNTKPNGIFDDVFAVFNGNSTFEDNKYSSKDSLDLDNVFYSSVVVADGLKLVLINNTIDVSTLPSRFNLCDWGWVTPVRDQGRIGSCWTFGTSGAIESAILRYLGFEVDISENNMEDVSLQYSYYGIIGAIEGVDSTAGAAYALSWLGVFPSEYDPYDQIGKVSSAFIANNAIHFQDVVFIPPRSNLTDNDLIKQAILKYGALAVGYYAEELAPYYNENTSAQYNNESIKSDHCVTLVGWDDSFSASNFLITPPGDGAWIIKNSWGTGFGDEGYVYISYYDVSFAFDRLVAFSLENTVNYNKNYQYDFIGSLLFSSGEEYINQYVAVDDDLIAGVGTYFNSTDSEYTVEIYVNGVLKHVQKGLPPFCGFHTIKLDSYIPIKKGDTFKVSIKTDTIPLFALSRQHFQANNSIAYSDGEWDDMANFNATSCIKVYTVVDDTKIINNKNISVDYSGGSYFSVKVVTADGHKVGAGEAVKFIINGKTSTVKTNNDGIAKIKITDLPKTYNIKTIYKGKTYNNKVKVKQVLSASKVTVKKTAKKFTLKAKLKINSKLIKGKKITFKINGKTYKVKTNAKGIAQKTFNKKFIKKLKKGKTYSVKVTYLKDTIKTTVKVR